MSIRVSRRAPKSAFAIAGVVVGAVALTGCTGVGSRTFGDPMVTGATSQTAQPNLSQPMPSTLGAPPPMQVAQGPFVPPANVGGFGGVQQGYSQPIYNSQPAYSAPTAYGAGAQPSVSSQDLPVLSSTSPMGTQQAMPAQQNLAPVAVMPQTAALGASAPMPTAPSVQGDAYSHTIASGESLYTIARRYDVTTQSIVQANGLTSPDKIVVGQKIVIPGRPDLLSTKAPTPTTQIAAITPAATPMPAQPSPAANGANVLQAAATPTPAATQPQAAPVQAAPAQVAALPPQEPAMSGSDKFRWPVSGRVITDFAASKGTGINIEASEGAAVQAAENGTVIYVGSGVEGYGNLVLIRHPNGFVSAYAHLKSMTVGKNDVVQRGQSIGSAGMTGSVSKPQVHFELRKGATPVDPVPLLAG